MKKNLLLILSLLLMMATEAQAQKWWNRNFLCIDKNFLCIDTTKLYTEVFAAANFLQDTRLDGNRATYDTGYVVGASLGYRWCYGFSLEAEYAFRRNSIDDIHFFVGTSSNNGHLQTSSYMANLLWDIPLSSWKCNFWNTQPFIGVGIGYDYTQMAATNSSFIFQQTWNQFAWQLMAGLVFPLFRNTDMTLEYKYHQGGGHFYDNSFGIGLVYNFGR